MIGFTNSLTTTINDRAERLREAAAREALVRAARRAEKASDRLAAVLRANREEQQAQFSWENHDKRRREPRRLFANKAVGKAR